MSPKKITDTDKLAIVELYRQAGDTTASLANRYGVSNSTISRLLKNTIPEAEYEELIQQKRGLKFADEDPGMAIAEFQSADLPPMTIIQTQLPLNSVASDLEKSAAPEDTSEIAPPLPVSPIAMETPPLNEDLSLNSRRVRRRSSAPMGDFAQPATTSTLSDDLADRSSELEPELPIQTALNITPAVPQPPSEGDRPGVEVVESFTADRAPVPPPVPRMPVLRIVRPLLDDDDLTVAVTSAPIESVGLDEGEDDEDEDINAEDVSVLAAMFGEEIAGDEDDFDDEEDDEEEENSAPNARLLTTDRHLQVTPLSQATLPRTCYIVIDKFAELIVRPLKDFADLGQIPGEEIQQRTLPVFDNHRLAKRFSNQRTQRVIKVPDSKVFHKTTPHLRSKGITRLLVDGNIYSLN